MKRLSLVLLMLGCFLAEPTLSKAADVCSIVSNAAIIAQDSSNTYLGKITTKYDSNSIFNEYGNYGSKYSSNSIWNPYSQFGNEYNAYSPFSKYSTAPPMLIKDRSVIGYLSSNKSVQGSVSPNLLKALCGDAF